MRYFFVLRFNNLLEDSLLCYKQESGTKPRNFISLEHQQYCLSKIRVTGITRIFYTVLGFLLRWLLIVKRGDFVERDDERVNSVVVKTKCFSKWAFGRASEQVH